MARRVLLRVARIAAGLGGFFVGGGALLSAVVGLEVVRARSAARAGQGGDAPDASGVFGDEHPGETLHLAMLGDSLAAGLGSGSAAHTLGAILASGLAAKFHQPVALHNVAVAGSRSRDLEVQIAALTEVMERPDVSVIVVGSNDVLGLDNIGASLRHLYRAVLDLRRLDCRVVVATCPDLGTVRPLIQPLRYLAHRLSRRLATAQTIVVVHAGGRAVPLGATLGSLFLRKPKSMFSADRFHPSPLGYARAAAVLFPSVRSSFEHRRQREWQGLQGAAGS